MIFALLGWIVVTTAITFGTYRLTKGNYYYTALFAAMTLFAPPLGVAAFGIFALLHTLKPVIREPRSVPLRTQPAKAVSPVTVEKNPHYEARLEAAQSEMEAAMEAVTEITVKIEALSGKDPASQTALETLEAERQKRALKLIAAEEAYDRLKKLRH